MAADVLHLTAMGRLLRFTNPDGLYPVNQYQSLVLATASEYAALTLAARRGVPLRELRAWEPCCGGGPVALSLKHLGLGYVQATDINKDALSACRSNATQNGILLDDVRTASLLDDGDKDLYDVIACNPPCGLGPHSDFGDDDAIRRAVSGGVQGIEITERLLAAVATRLTASGSFVFVVVSTGNVAAVARLLDEQFSGRWRTIAGTPVAAPYAPADDPRIELLLSSCLGYSPFIWKRSDGWFWRLTWIIEATLATWDPPFHPGFALCPFGQEISQDPALRERVQQFSGDGFWLRQ